MGDDARAQSSVSLAEVLTLIAFGEALSAAKLRSKVDGRAKVSISKTLEEMETLEERMRAYIAGTHADLQEVPGLDHFADRDEGLRRLGEAWRQLREEVKRGEAKMWGRHSTRYSAQSIHLSDEVHLSREKLAAFSQFDISTGGIRRQPPHSPDVLWAGHPASFDREVDAFGDEPLDSEGYLLVEVERHCLKAQDSAAGSARAPSFKAGRPPDDQSILAKASEMKARGLDGRTIARDMRLEAGFENVANTQVRTLITGRWTSEGRPRNKGA